MDEIRDVMDEPLQIQKPHVMTTAARNGGVIVISIHEDGERCDWCGNRDQLRELIETLQKFEHNLGPKKNDASNLPPMSNKVEGGSHFGLG